MPSMTGGESGELQDSSREPKADLRSSNWKSISTTRGPGSAASQIMSRSSAGSFGNSVNLVAGAAKAGSPEKEHSLWESSTLGVVARFSSWLALMPSTFLLPQLPLIFVALVCLKSE